MRGRVTRDLPSISPVDESGSASSAAAWQAIGSPDALLGGTVNALDWLVPDAVAGCIYPDEEALGAVARLGISGIVNLHEQPHPRAALARHGLTELHLPVRDYTPPTLSQIETALEAIEDAVTAGKRVAVAGRGWAAPAHCLPATSCARA